MKYTDEGDLQWVAGLFEGEGWLSQATKSGNWTLGIKMTDVDVLETYAALFDLTVKKHTQKKPKPENWKDYFQVVTGKRSKIFSIICDIYPYLGARRREKCDEFLQWYAAKKGLRYD